MSESQERVAGCQLDAEIAEVVFGRTHLVGADVPPFFAHLNEPVEKQEVWVLGEREWWCRLCGSLPEFSTDIAAASLVEAEIERRGLGEAYFVALVHLVIGWMEFRASDPASRVGAGFGFKLLRATPEQRCLAALAALSADSSSSVLSEDTP